MFALTLLHPWPYAIARLGKRIENRGWKPPNERVGSLIALHGGKHPTAAGCPREAWRNVGQAWAILQARGLDAGVDPRAVELIVEGVFAVARYGGAVHARSMHVATKDPWFEGPYGWLLEDLVVLPEPVPCRGAQGLWRLPTDVWQAVRNQLKEVSIE